MARYSCRNGHQWTGPGSLSKGYHPSILQCPKCDLRAEPKLRQSSGTGLKDTRETDAHREARERFNDLVCEWPCWARAHRRGHRCRGPKDAHHLLPKEWIARVFSDLPEDELLAIKFEPVIGAPACRFEFHAALEDRNDVILWHELDDEVKLFCQRIDARYPGRESMLRRLEGESPRAREAA